MKINHDFHIHTYLSLCAPDKTGTVENYVQSAKAQGLTKLGFADHFWGSEPGDSEYYNNVRSNPDEYYRIQNFEYILSTRDEIDLVKAKDIKLYFGAECEYDPFKKSIAVKREDVESFDFLIVPVSHTHMMMPESFYMPYEKHIDFMFDAFYDVINCEFSKYITAIAHPFRAVASPYDKKILNRLISDERYKKAFDAAANKNIAMEINVAAFSHGAQNALEAMEEDIRLLLLAKECGCKFTFGSDAHSLGEHENYSSANVIVDILNLKMEDIAEIAR